MASENKGSFKVKNSKKSHVLELYEVMWYTFRLKGKQWRGLPSLLENS